MDTHYILEESPGNCAELKKPISKGYVLYDLTYITLFQKTKFWKERTDWWFPGVRDGRGVGGGFKRTRF